MAVFPGFQKTVDPVVFTAYPGDPASDKTFAQLNADGYFALGDLSIGLGAFLAPSGNQVATVSATAGTTAFAGIVTRNAGLAPMGWNDSQAGYGFVVPNGTQGSVAVAGDYFAVLTGVDGTGTPNHVPVVGDFVWCSLTNGTFATAPSTVTAVTGYVRCGSSIVTKVGAFTVPGVTIGTNQTFGVISGQFI